MRRVGDLVRDAVQTALRLLPWPTEPGLRRSGSPGPESPVVVTGNYDLTVRRVLRALRGVDAWVVVAPSGGINVWCAASGGHLTTHQVVTALKTSGIEEHVRHRRAILPQLAATGVQGRELTRRCGWRARFGPARAEDLPRYLASGGHKSPDMRRVRFGPRERLEMAAAWGVPAALALGGVGAWLRPGWGAPLAGLALVAAAAVFLLYDRSGRLRGPLFGGVLVVAATSVVGLAGGGAAALAAGALASAGLFGLLTFDYPGSTPIEGGSHFQERRWRITLDEERCRGVNSCFEVCPEGCYEKRPGQRTILLAHDERCIRCGACVVQCPMDALSFEDETGARIAPDLIRRFKLDLLSRRGVDTGDTPPAS